MKKHAALLLVLVMVLVFTVGCGGGSSENGPSGEGDATEAIELICAHGYPAVSDEQKWLAWMADELDKRTDGGLTMKVYSDGTLGSEMEVCAQILAGAIDIGLSEGSAWADATNVPALSVFGLPYLYNDLDGMKNAGLTVVPEAFQTLLEENNVNLQGFVPFSGGLRNVWTVSKPIRTVSDFAGMKMRVPEIKLFADTMRGLGANPTPVAWTELFTALGQGVVDGLEIDPATGVANNLHEVTKYYTRTYHLGSLNIIAMNKEKWESLPAEYQEIFTQVAYEAAEQQFDERAASIGQSEQVLAEAGLELIDLSDEDIATLTANMKPIWAEYSDEYGLGDIIAALSEAGKQPYQK
jgi:TRAP-type C4-dicarboxylate transport system substrate-binding protein